MLAVADIENANHNCSNLDFLECDMMVMLMKFVLEKLKSELKHIFKSGFNYSEEVVLIGREFTYYNFKFENHYFSQQSPFEGNLRFILKRKMSLLFINYDIFI